MMILNKFSALLKRFSKFLQVEWKYSSFICMKWKRSSYFHGQCHMLERMHAKCCILCADYCILCVCYYSLCVGVTVTMCTFAASIWIFTAAMCAFDATSCTNCKHVTRNCMEINDTKQNLTHLIIEKIQHSTSEISRLAHFTPIMSLISVEILIMCLMTDVMASTCTNENSSELQSRNRCKKIWCKNIKHFYDVVLMW